MRNYVGEVCTDARSGKKLEYYTLTGRLGYGLEIREAQCKHPEIAAVYGITESYSEINLLAKSYLREGVEPCHLTELVDNYLDG